MEYASEFRYRNPIISDDDIVIAVSQSGETADTLAAVELARKAGAFVFGICNVVGSSIARATDSGAYIHVGPEIGVASTKAFTGQVTVMAMLALAVGREKGTVTEAYYREVATATAATARRAGGGARSRPAGSPTSRKYSPMRTTSSTWGAATTTPRRSKGRSNSRRFRISTPRATPPPR